jgi:hypothetical protein
VTRRSGVYGPSEEALARVRAGRNPLFSTDRGVDATALLPLPTGSGKCRAETFDGIEPKRCTRPASFLRDGLAVCIQHGHLDRVRAAQVSL